MPASADQLLDLLQERRLLPQPLINGLRRQVAEAPDQFNAHHVAKLLQRKGKITAYQARELLAELEGRDVDDVGEPPQAGDDLGLVELDDDKPSRTSLGSSPESKTKEEPPAQLAALDELEDLNEPASLSAMDDVLDDPLAAPSSASPLSPLGKKPRKKRLASGWDSPLIIVGGGMLLLLLMVGAVLAFVLTRGSGDELFAAAEQDYLDGAYGQAIGKYERFVGRHSSHPDVSMARVRIALAKLRMEVSAENWPAALARAKEELPEIVEEPALGQARGELAALLPDIAHGFAEQAKEESDLNRAAEIVEQFQAAMKLVENPTYLPASQRASQNARIERTRETIASVMREVEQQGKLTETIAQIESLAGGDDVMSAYARRDELLQQYPRLRDHADLLAAVRGISNQLADRVTLNSDVVTALKTDRDSPIVGSAALADVSGESIAELAGHVVPMVIDGAVYTLAADSGRLLWRRFVGQQSKYAALTSEKEGADTLVFDSANDELLRLSGADGALVWRLPVPGRCEFVVTGEDQLLLAMLDAGELWEVDLASGDCSRRVVFPQPLAAPPAVTESGHVVQLADHSNVYLLDQETLACRGVYFLGHARGTVQHPPVASAGIVIVPHQIGRRRALLHVLRETVDSPGLALAQPPWAMEGRIAGPLPSDGLRMAAFDERGALSLLAMDPAAEEAPLKKVAQATGGTQIVSVEAVMRDAYLFVGTNRLAAFHVAAAQGTLTPRWINHAGDNFVAPPKVLGKYVFHARRRPNQAGVIIAATARDDDQAQNAGRPIWENTIAPGAPQGGWLPADDGETLIAVLAKGDAYELPLDLDTREVSNIPTTRAVRRGNYQQALRLNSRRMVLLGDEQPPSTADHQVLFPEPLPSDLANYNFSRSVIWRGGLLAPSQLGRIELLETNPEATSLYPFQPPLLLNQRIGWLRPAVVDDDTFVACTESGKLYLVGMSTRGAPHLAAVAESTLAMPPATAPVARDDRVVVVARGQRNDALVTFELPSLSGESQIELPGRLRWGPFAVGDLLLLSTTPGDLQAFAKDGRLLWSAAIDGKLPVGKPALNEQVLAVAMSDGTVLRWSVDDGELVSRIDVGQPLADGPLLIGRHITVRAADGTILQVANEVNNNSAPQTSGAE